MFKHIISPRKSIFPLALLGAVLLWAAQAPLDWGFLGWIAPVPWIWFIRQKCLPGRRPYIAFWVVGFLFWMATLHFLRLPHPATSIGWVAVSLYMAFYLPIFVALSRIGVHRCRLSVILVAPLVWTGLELVRAHLFTGITLGALAYTQYQFLSLIQIASVFGFYGVGFVVMFIAACLGRMLPCDPLPDGSEATDHGTEKELLGENQSNASTGWTISPLLPAVLLLGATLGYGYFRLHGHSPVSKEHTIRVGLIQGSIDSTMKSDETQIDDVDSHYHDLTMQAIHDHTNLDLIVWPETMYRYGLSMSDPNPKIPEIKNKTKAEVKAGIRFVVKKSRDTLIEKTKGFKIPIILGLDTRVFTSDGLRFYNSSILVCPSAKSERGVLKNRYDKMHRVLFGEYVPFADIFPAIQNWTPLKNGIHAGTHAQVYEIGHLRFCPSICYENVMPHLIRRQVNELQEKRLEPDVLVTLTNDGWFWGSSALDLHLACAVFRAVECRKPMLVAANTGISAWVDATGAIRDRGPRRDTGLVIAEVGPHQDSSPYLDLGDWFAGLCLIFCVFLLFFPLFARLFVKKSPGPLATGNGDV